MSWKHFWKPNLFKLILTLILVAVAGYFEYFILSNAIAIGIKCITAPCPQPELDLLTFIVALMPLIIFFYFVGCTVAMMKVQGFKGGGKLNWLHLIAIIPLIFFKPIIVLGALSQIRFGLLQFVILNRSFFLGTWTWRFGAVNTALLSIDILISLLLFVSIYLLVRYKVNKSR